MERQEDEPKSTTYEQRFFRRAEVKFFSLKRSTVQFRNNMPGFAVYCLTFCFEFFNHHILKTKQLKIICIEEKVIIRINFNPGLALTGFRTDPALFSTRARDLIEKPSLGERLTSKNT